MSAAALVKALRAEADAIADVRCELRAGDTDRDERLYPKLNNASELVRILARLVEGRSIHQAFGAPGDFGYDTPIGAALSAYYSSPRPMNLNQKAGNVDENGGEIAPAYTGP
jgi:hypothetical protein